MATPYLDWLLLTKRPENIMPSLRVIMCLGGEHAGKSAATVMERGEAPNVWVGTSVENQAAADERIVHLLDVPAAVRFLSCEPLLGPVDLERVLYKGEHRFDCLRGGYWCEAGYAWGAPSAKLGAPKGGFVNHSDIQNRLINWVICGGESGPDARPMHPAWARSLRDQCAAAGVPFFLKQWGEWREPLEGECYTTANGRAGKPPAFIVESNGRVHCFKNDAHEDPTVMIGVGKKHSGRLLDGVEHSAFPEVANAAAR